MGRLDNKVALVTGGNSGIGRATARLFAKEGARVFVVSRRADRNEQIVNEIREAGGAVASAACDLSEMESCRAAVDACIAEFGRIDVLVNSAGIADKHKPITRCDEDWYDHVVKIDQYSTYWMCKYALEDMEKRGEGSIVNISSIGSQGVAGIAYSAAKAAVNAMTKNIACFYANTGIRCNAVAPGPTPTELNTPEKIATFDEFAGVCAPYGPIASRGAGGGPGARRAVLRERRLEGRDGADSVRRPRDHAVLGSPIARPARREGQREPDALRRGLDHHRLWQQGDRGGRNQERS